MSKYDPRDKIIRFSPPLSDAIRQFRFGEQINSHAEAVRRLVALGLKAAAKGKQPAGVKWFIPTDGGDRAA